ncbi:MAG: chromosome segregation protein SMC [Chloroflexi bacterium]|nr:chromosome segregation protein SMC [Chloroflexota bacterium]
MYLKRLDLHGFKSFASPTSFEFAGGVTCIAGPNGAGKTNVAEAIRWVLGEQATRVVRARKTEDFIFSGSSTRSAMGMAEVRITLDNADGWLPLEFEEVVVSRRAFRSGDNEYYINDSRVRLKDITQLFLKAQVGQNSYAFMGQGLVEQVLTLRPEERRGLIEEAAEVRLHREKLDESRNRLRATQENLDRVQLIVNEIEPRLRQLERQADRASAHARLSGELAQALQSLFGQQWQEAQEALVAARAACDQRQEEFDRNKQDIEARDEGLASLTTAIAERRRDIEAREEAYRNVEDYRRDLRRRIGIDEERVTLLTARGEELVGEIATLTTEQEELAELTTAQEERARTLDEELAAARSPDADSKALEEHEQRLGETSRALAEIDSRIAEIASSQAEADANVSAHGGQRERLATDLASLEEERKEQIALLKTWAQEFALRQERRTERAPIVQRAVQELNENEALLEQATDDTRLREEKVRTIATDITSLEVRLEAAEATEIELPLPDAGIRALLAAGGRVPGEEPDADTRIHGLIGLIGELLRVPEGLERAIESALAESLHAVVVETQEDALAATELLTSEDLGRAVIFPLADIRAGHPINLMEERGVLGVASELVRCEARYRPLVDTLLGRTIVAENLGVAKMLLRRGLGSVVTLDGILLHPSGSIAAGGAKAVRRAIVRHRQVGELPAQLRELRASQEEATAELEEAANRRQEAQRDHDQLAPDLARMQRELRAMEDSLRQHQARLPATAATLTGLRRRLLEVRQALAESEAAEAAARENVTAATAQAQELAGVRQQLVNDREEQTATREGLVKRTATRTTRIATLETEQESLGRQRTMQAAAVSRVQEGLGRRGDLAGEAQKQLADLHRRVEAARRELAEKSTEAESAREELAPAQHSLEQLESRQRALTEELAAGRSHALSAERALLDAQASVNRRAEEQDALRERLTEEGFQPSDEGDIVPAVQGGDHPPAWLTSEPSATNGELPPMRGGAEADPVALKERVLELRGDIRKLGPVNEQAEEDFSESRERYDYLTAQMADLQGAEASLQEAIDELERIIKERFSATFKKVSAEFKRYFETFFRGGHGELVLTAPDERGLPGVDVIAQPPRKRVKTINMLSGGERSLTALALLFALLETHPSPICVLDEVDAALDEANVDRFTGALKDLAQRTQFIIITHNRRTLEIANTIYGISMGGDSTSAVLSLKLGDVPA